MKKLAILVPKICQQSLDSKTNYPIFANVNYLHGYKNIITTQAHFLSREKLIA